MRECLKLRWIVAGIAMGIEITTSVAVAGPALLFDAADGKVLYAEDQDNQWHPASLTKIMTAYLSFEAIKTGKLTLATKIAASELAFNQAPSKIGLPVGAEITVETALQALIIKSANDVAVMLAEAVEGNQEAFVEHMNAVAQRLGMTRTHFANPNGLPAVEQATTARDLAKLARAVIRDYPEYQRIWAQADMQIGRRHLRTHNGLLTTYEGADGLKTGFICDSGYNVVASATRDDHKLVAVVLGELTGRERSIRAASLLEHGFQMLGWKSLFNTATIETLPIDNDAKSVTSIRDQIVAWDCGGRSARVVAKVRQKRLEAAQAALGKAGAKTAPSPDATSGPKTPPPASADGDSASRAAGRDIGSE
jgi:D-alanyl-D-alanine carboxypeptidase